MCFFTAGVVAQLQPLDPGPVRRAERDYPRDKQDPITSCNHPTTSTTGTGNSPATPTPNHSTSFNPRSRPGYTNDLVQKNLKDKKNMLQIMIRAPRIPQCLDDLFKTPAKDAGLLYP